MRRFITSILLIIALIVALSQPAAHSALLALLFLGIIPGTNIQIPFWAMLLVFFGGGYVLIRWLGSQPLYIGGLAKQGQTARQLARKKVARKVHKSTTRTKAKRSYQSTKKRSINRLA